LTTVQPIETDTSLVKADGRGVPHLVVLTGSRKLTLGPCHEDPTSFINLHALDPRHGWFEPLAFGEIDVDVFACFINGRRELGIIFTRILEVMDLNTLDSGSY
jgi:hypothetical protein